MQSFSKLASLGIRADWYKFQFSVINGVQPVLVAQSVVKWVGNFGIMRFQERTILLSELCMHTLGRTLHALFWAKF